MEKSTPDSRPILEMLNRYCSAPHAPRGYGHSNLENKRPNSIPTVTIGHPTLHELSASTCTSVVLYTLLHSGYSVGCFFYTLC